MRFSKVLLKHCLIDWPSSGSSLPRSLQQKSWGSRHHHSLNPAVLRWYQKQIGCRNYKQWDPHLRESKSVGNAEMEKLEAINCRWDINFWGQDTGALPEEDLGVTFMGEKQRNSHGRPTRTWQQWLRTGTEAAGTWQWYKEHRKKNMGQDWYREELEQGMQWDHVTAGTKTESRGSLIRKIYS